MSERARIRLRPGKGRRFLAGAPWAFADEIVMDRRTRALMPGSVAVLEDAGRSPIACVAFNPGSKIAVRRLDDDPAAEIGPAWLHERLARALRLRRRLFDDDVCRLVHAEADGLPGVIVDRYGDAAVIQPNAAWAEALAGALVDALIEVTGISKVVINRMGRARRLEGLGEGLDIAAGHLDGPLRVRMNGATYLADLTGGQKTGLFLDQRLNHAFSARLGRGLTVLDLFCHVGGFGLAALAGGAESVLAVDGSAEALELARAGAEASGVAERYRTRRGDGFETLRALAGEDRRFGMVVCDPPAFAPAKPALDAGLRAYGRLSRLAAALVAPEGFLVLCSCSHAVSAERFREVCTAGIARAGRTGRILAMGGAGPDHPIHPALGESGYLKALFLQLD